MGDRRYRVLAIASHPVQYMSPILRQMAHHPQLDLQVAYCTLRGAKPMHDPEFNTTVQWDIPLLDGYDWVEVPNSGSGRETFFGLNNPGLWRLVGEGRFDAVLCYLGYVRASFWISYLASKRSKAAFLFGTDAWSLVSRDGSRWKYHLKKLYWPLLFSLAKQVIVPSSATRDLMLSLKIPASRITLTPYTVDNHWWYEKSQEVDRNEVRAGWGANAGTTVILFCAKLQEWKRPMDLLRAFAKLAPGLRQEALLVFAGEGHQRAELESEAAVLGISDRARFLGFINQSQLPAVYTAADLMVLPSKYEPFAVVVNEAYCCGCPVAVSDRVGAGRDLVAPVNPGLVFPFGDIEALAEILRKGLGDRDGLEQMGRNGRNRILTWSPRENIAGAIEAIARATERTAEQESAGK